MVKIVPIVCENLNKFELFLRSSCQKQIKKKTKKELCKNIYKPIFENIQLCKEKNVV